MKTDRLLEFVKKDLNQINILSFGTDKDGRPMFTPFTGFTIYFKDKNHPAVKFLTKQQRKLDPKYIKKIKPPKERVVDAGPVFCKQTIEKFFIFPDTPSET